MELTASRGILSLDPRTKLVCILSAGCLLVGTIPLWAEMLFLGIGILLLLNYSMVLESMKFVTCWAAMMLLGMLLLHSHASGGTMFLLLMCQLMRRFIPCLMAALMFVRTTTISQLMAAVQSMHMPYGVAIPFAVVIRFFPTFREEHRNIKLSMKMRGIRYSLEHILVPMLHSALNISDELSAAALSRGLGAEKKRTHVCVVTMGPMDWILSCGMLALMITVYVIR